MRRSYTPEYSDCRDADNGYDETPPCHTPPLRHCTNGTEEGVPQENGEPLSHGTANQDGLIVIHTHVPALLISVAMLDHGHALLPQEGKITSLLPHREGRSTKQNHQGRLKNMMRSVDPILLNIMIAGMLTMVMIRRRRHLMVSDPGRWAGHPSHPLQDGLIFIHTCSRSPELRGRARSRSCSPAPGRRGDDQYASPQRKEEQQTKSSRRTKEHDEERRSYTPEYIDHGDAFIGHDETPPSADWGRVNWALCRQLDCRLLSLLSQLARLMVRSIFIYVSLVFTQ